MEGTLRYSGDSILHEQELVPSSAGGTDRSVTCDDDLSSRRGNLPSSYSLSTTGTALVNDATRPSESQRIVNDTTAILQSNHTGQNGIYIFQGLIERARRTVRGSADDIGWLQRDLDMPPVEDGTERFIEILDHIRHGGPKLPSSLVYLLVPVITINKQFVPQVQDNRTTRRSYPTGCESDAPENINIIGGDSSRHSVRG